MKKFKVMAFEVLGFLEHIKAENKEEAIQIFEEMHSKRKLMPDSSEGLDGIEAFELKDWQ
jgi:pentatricopeptide repeat protein